MSNGLKGKPMENRVIEKMLGVNEQYETKTSAASCKKFQLEVCIDIGNGTTGFIRLDSNSNPYQLALDFCVDYNIDQSVAPLLAKTIISKLKEEASNDSRGSPIVKHKLSQSLIQQTQPFLRDITSSFVNQQPQNQSSKRRQSLSECERRHKSRKNTEPCQVTQIEEQHFAYHPKINHISKQIVERLKKKNILDSAEDTQKRKEQRVARMKKENEVKEISECSFKPKINLISQKVDVEMHRHSRPPSQKRYEQLYQHSFLMERSKEHSRKASLEKNSFKPEINRISKTIMAGVNFQQRQERFRKKTEPIVIIHKPKTGRMPKERNTKHLPIGDYLYEQGKQRVNARNTVSANNSRRPSVTHKSQDIFNQLKQNKLKEVFELLDSKKTGILWYEEIDFDILDKETFSIFEPIFEEMKEIEVSLDLEEFLEAGSRLIHNLTPNERGVLFNTKKKVQEPEKYSFQPQINRPMRPTTTDKKDIYLRCLVEKKRHHEKVAQHKENIVRNELYECTFKPKISRAGRFI